MPPRRSLLAAALLIVSFAGLSLWEMTGDSLTTDELWHLPVGYAYWKTGEFRLSPEHPPLAKLLCAATLLPLRLGLPPTTPPPGTTWHDYPALFGSAFFRLNPDVDRILFRSRLPVLALGGLLLLTIFFWSWRLHGHPGAGLLSLALASLEPTLIAHSHFVTTDIALAAFALLAFAALWRFCDAGRMRHLALAVTAMGLALASKFSALVLLPMFFLLLLLRWPGGAGGRRPGLARRGLAALAALFVMATIVQACYFFSSDLSLYLRGPAEVQAYKPVNHVAYVRGAFHVGGVFWYALYAWLIKTPLPTLAITALGFLLYRRDPHRTRDVRQFILMPAGLYALAVCLLASNYGVRYLIPMTAFLLVLAGAAHRWFVSTPTRRLAAAGLALWLVVSLGRAAPHFIAYFNELIGGPADAAQVIHDSNVDWGQDLKRLARYQQKNGIPELILFYWGGAQPDHYGVRFRPLTFENARADRPPDGTYAISVNHLVDMKRSVVLGGVHPNLDWLGRFRPSDRVGYSIYIYRFGP